VRILLDTQVWLWMLADPGRLSETGRMTLTDPSTELLLSAASTWEIAIKVGLGKLRLPGPAARVIPVMMKDSGVEPLAVLHSHSLAVADLPPHHRDPFDRLLVAQARLEGIPIMTADSALTSYDVQILEP
jgi:PIN domain nuclease of toxin-antitoxin system